MAKVWVLDSGTKGTGASVVPLEKPSRGPDAPLALVPLGRPRPEARPEPEPAPHVFKVVDVVSGEVVAEDATGAVMLGALERFRSVVDVRVYVRKDEHWRLLTLPELKSLWKLRGAPLTRRGRPGGAGRGRRAR